MKVTVETFSFHHKRKGTKNNKVKIAQGGHNKQKRSDLGQFDLAIVTTKDFLLPLFSYLYEGNRNDV